MFRTYSNLHLNILDADAHGRTCGYWYTVTDGGGMAHTAFATKAGLQRWLKERGLKVEDLPDPGKRAHRPIVGTYSTKDHCDLTAFFDLSGLRTRTLSNAEWTLAIITKEHDNTRTVHTLNCNIKERRVYDYAESRARFN